MPFYEFTAEVSGSLEAYNEEEARREIRAMFHRFGSVDIIEIEKEGDESTDEDVDAIT